MTALAIKFEDLGGPVYAGRPRGEQLRREFNLDAIDQQGVDVEVSVPDGTYSVTSSFFLGLFGPSIVRAGTEDAFFERFHFHAKDLFTKSFHVYAARALVDKTLF